MKSEFNPFDYFFILRPLILIPSWNFLLIGGYLAWGKSEFTVDLLIALVIYTSIMGGIYILNQIMDIETDRINKKLFLLSGEYISVKNAYLELAILWFIGLCLALKFGTIFLIFIVISLVMGILYSLPPVKLKGKPILDMLSNGIGYGMINFAVGWLVFGDFYWLMFIKFMPYFLSISAVFINTTIVDIEGDQRAKEQTSAVFLGANIAYALSACLMVLAIFTAYVQKDLICLIPAVVSLPLYIYCLFYATIKKGINRKMTIASFRLPGLILTFITGVLYPPYLIFLILLLIGMRVYYKNRFGLGYPSIANG